MMDYKTYRDLIWAAIGLLHAISSFPAQELLEFQETHQKDDDTAHGIALRIFACHTEALPPIEPEKCEKCGK